MVSLFCGRDQEMAMLQQAWVRATGVRPRAERAAAGEDAEPPGFAPQVSPCWPVPGWRMPIRLHYG